MSKADNMLIMLIAALMVPLLAFSQQRFHHELPPGNYSGICSLGDGRFALVSDKAAEDGFYVVRIGIDSLRDAAVNPSRRADQPRITSMVNEGYRSSGQPNRDMEGICYFPPARTLFISGERDNEVLEYTLDGQRTGRRLLMPADFQRASHNYGIEALCYDTLRHRFFLTTERPLTGDSLLRLQSFTDDLKPAECYLYRPDAPISRKYFHGVSALCALSDGRLLVLERQLRVPRLKLGARAVTRIYEVTLPPTALSPAPDSAQNYPTLPPQLLNSFTTTKRLLLEFTTRLTLTSRKFANYEGLCEPAPGLLLLVADSQNRYKGVLRDWFRLVKQHRQHGQLH